MKSLLNQGSTGFKDQLSSQVLVFSLTQVQFSSVLGLITISGGLSVITTNVFPVRKSPQRK